MSKSNLLSGIVFVFMLFLSGCGGGGGGTETDSNNTNDTPSTEDSYPSQIDTTEATQAGDVFYVDPASGNINNDGSASSPWNTFQDVIENNKIESMEYEDYPYEDGATLVVKNSGAPVKAGDTIILKAGYHGDVLIQRYLNNQYINVIAEAGAIVSKLHVVSGCKWKFKGLTVRPESGNTEKYSLVQIESSNWSGPSCNITLDDFTIYTVEDSSASWSTTDLTDWDTLSCNGITVAGDNMTIRRNYLKNVDFGITVSGNYALVKGNTVENFAGDGLRGLGNDMYFEYNTVKNLYQVNDNHPDGFQSWSLASNGDPPRERVFLRGNLIINYTDPNQPFRGNLQGIGCYDGPYIDWVVENNVVIVDHWHGISLYGAQDSRIVNNTVVDLNDDTTGPPWAGFFDRKDGTPSSNCILRNNIAQSFQISDGVTADHNYQIPDYSSYTNLFVDPINYNFHLKAGTAPIDAGGSDQTPEIDKDGRSRPQGNGVDIGAYEF
jgi:hypothetical protein